MFTKCRSKIKQLTSKFDALLLKHIDTALHITGKLKSFLSSDLAVMITTLTPTDIDNVYRVRVLNALEQSLFVFGIIKNLNEYSLEQLLQKIKLFLLTLPEPQREAVLIKLASLITSKLDNRHQQSFYDAAAQLQYTIIKT